MGDYENYKRGRDLAWEALIKSGVSALPVDLKKVAHAYGINVVSYKKALEMGLITGENIHGKVFVKVSDGKRIVFVDNGLKYRGSIRFLIAKGIGYCLLSKTPWFITDTVDYEAGIFARDLLMPATVLSGLCVKSASRIESLCDVSKRAAELRAERMAELYDRNRFNQHPLERKVSEQFKKFIEENKSPQ